MNSTDKGKTENIKNAFDTVVQMYNETAFLFKDFNKSFADKGFESMMPSNGIGYESSKSLDWPDFWIIRYASWFYKPKKQHESEKRFVSVTVVFFDYDKVMDPYLSISILENQDSKSYVLPYHKYQENKESLKGKDGKIIELSDEINMLAMPLLQVGGTEKIEELTTQIVDFWEKKYGKIK